jgi:hypothetical protein
MRLKEFAHGFELSGSVDRFFGKGSFGKDEEQNCALGLYALPPAISRTSAAAASSSYGDSRTRGDKAASASSKPKRKSR